MAQQRTPTPEEQAANRRIIRRVFGGLGIVSVILGVLIMIVLGADAIRLRGGPEQMTLPEVAAVASETRTYAALTGASWHCDSIAYIEGLSGSDFSRSAFVRKPGTRYTDIMITDETRSVAVMVTLSGKVTCDDLDDKQPSGFVYAVDGRLGGMNAPARAIINDADTVLTMCGYCGVENARTGLIVGGAFALMGVGLFVLVWFINRAEHKPETS